MQGAFVHWCIRVLDLQKSLDFYERALGLTVYRTIVQGGGLQTISFLANDKTPFQVELIWRRDRSEPYENGGKDTHIAFEVDDYEAAHKLHEEMGCIVRENYRHGYYFIVDPDGSMIEILHKGWDS